MLIFIITGVLTAVMGLILAVPGVFRRFCRAWIRQAGSEEREKYRCLDVRTPPEQTMSRELRQRLRMVWLVLMVGLVPGLFLQLFNAGGERVGVVQRPEFGEGKETLPLTAELPEGEEAVVLTIEEQQPDEAQLDAFFQQAASEACEKVLGDNEDFSHVTKDLNLITGMAGGIEIEWQVSDPDLINILGSLNEDIPMEGADVTLTMKMVYGNFSRSFEISATLWPDDADAAAGELEAYLNEQIAASPEAKEIALPTEYMEGELVLRRESNQSGRMLAALVLIGAVLMWLTAGSRLEESYRKRNQGMLQDYPDIVSRLAILFSAGLTIPAAWERLTADYERELREGKPRRFGYEEMRLTALELRNYGYTDRVFGEFGRRCKSYRYMKLANLLEQSMKKGTVQLDAVMEQEALQAFELRKAQAAKTGEEAGSKLLLPMMMMFGLVIVMVVVPAWSSMNF